MIKQAKSLYGYRELLVYKKAEELQMALADYVKTFSHSKTLLALSDQMERSARSTKQNITEGWKRNSTREYYQFLGYAVASNAELEEDFTDILRGVYAAKGVEGGKWEKREWEKILFYPLNPILPICLQLKLRAKELNYLLDKLQKSLTDKMGSEGILSVADKLKRQKDRRKDEEDWFRKSLKEQGSVRLENGQIIERAKWEKGEAGKGFKEWNWDR
ncbi:MAG: four helix bundle protein [Patescibacteria group bacterium]